MDRQTEIQKQALQYQNQGYSIIPLMPESKRAAIEWKKFQNEKATKEQVEEWFSQRDTNIGIVTGKISGITVVDIDPKHGGKVEDFADIETYQVRTPSGGLHLYFQYHQELKQTTGLAKGIDIRNDGGYVAAPPSFLENGSYDVIKNISFAEVPQRVLELQRITKNNKEVQNWDIAQGVDEGSRNESLAKLTGKLLHYIPEADWKAVIPLLEGWNNSCNPPLERDEFERTFDSIASRERAKIQDSSNITNLTFYTVNDILTMKLEEPYWLLRGFIAKGLVTLIAGLPKDGKSTFIYSGLAKMQQGESFLDMETRQSKVLILSEESLYDIRHRLILQKCKTDNIIISDLTPRQSWSSWPKLIENVLSKCKEQGIDLVVIDTLAEIWPVDKENEVGDIMKAFAPLRILQREEIAILLVHHLNKNLADQGRGIRGSSAIAGATSINIEYGKPEGYPNTTQRKISCRGRYMHITPSQLIIDYNEFDGEYRMLGTEAQVVRQKKIDTILKILSEGNMTNIEIREHWPEDEKSPDRTALSKRLNALIKEEQVRVVEKVGRNEKVYGLNTEKIQAEEIKKHQQLMKATEIWESHDEPKGKASQIIEIAPAKFNYN